MIEKGYIVDCWSFETGKNLDNCIEKRKKAKVVQSLNKTLKFKKPKLLNLRTVDDRKSA